MFGGGKLIYGQPSLFNGEEGNVVEVINASGYGIDAQAALVHETAVEKGFWPMKYYDTKTMLVTEEAICTKLALIHSEVTEVLEAIRKDQGKAAIVEEMADIYIRLIDLYAAMYNTGQVDASLNDVVELKMNKNASRPQLHGNKF